MIVLQYLWKGMWHWGSLRLTKKEEATSMWGLRLGWILFLLWGSFSPTNKLKVITTLCRKVITEAKRDGPTVGRLDRPTWQLVSFWGKRRQRGDGVATAISLRCTHDLHVLWSVYSHQNLNGSGKTDCNFPQSVGNPSTWQVFEPLEV